MADNKDVVPPGEIGADATAAEDSRSIEKTEAEGRVKQERQGNDTEKTETVTESAVTQSLQEKEIEHVKDLAIEEKGSGEQRESGTKDKNEKETPKFLYDAELMMKNIYQDTEVQVDPATIQLLTDGFVTRFLPSLEKARSSIGQIKSIQTVLIETVQQETAKFNECQGYAELEEKMIKARQYHNKLLRLKKEMINLSEKSKKLKKRAVKLQQQKQKEELERAHDQEKEYEKERMLQMFHKVSPELLMLFLDSLDDDDLDDMLLLNCADQNLRMKYTRGFSLDAMDDDQCWENFRLKKDDIPRLAVALRMDEYVITLNRLKVPRIEALCIFLRRMAYPNRLGDIGPFFRRCREDISYISSAVLHFIFRTHKGLLGTLQHAWIDIDVLSAAVRDKGAPLQNCIGFIDGTVRPIARPLQNQREVYNGHKRTHALKYQSVILPNGIIAHMHGPESGRRHDAGLLRESNLLQELEALGDVCLYGDPAYPLKRNLIVGFRGANLTPQQQEFNKQMSSLRTSVEWGFGEIVKFFAFVDFKKNQKLLLQPVGKQYLVAVILFNCHTCLYGSLTSSFFSCDPPSLEEYLQ